MFDKGCAKSFLALKKFLKLQKQHSDCAFILVGVQCDAFTNVKPEQVQRFATYNRIQRIIDCANSEDVQRGVRNLLDMKWARKTESGQF